MFFPSCLPTLSPLTGKAESEAESLFASNAQQSPGHWCDPSTALGTDLIHSTVGAAVEKVNPPQADPAPADVQSPYWFPSLACSVHTLAQSQSQPVLQ